MDNKLKIRTLILAGAMMTATMTGCYKENQVQPISEHELPFAEKTAKSAQTLNTAYRNGELVRTQNNVLINQANTMAVFKVSTLTMRSDFTFFPTVFVASGAVNMYAIYKVNGQTTFIQTTRSNVTAGNEAQPFVLRRASLPAMIDGNEVQILVTRATNVSAATIHFRLYRDYTNNPIGWTSNTPDNQLNGTSCVSYIRGKITTLASASVVPLNSYTQKKAILNVRDDAGQLTKNIKFARKGMAIVAPAAAPWTANGHIAYIEEIHSDGTITVKEGNSGGNFTIRRRFPDGSVYTDPVSGRRFSGLNIDGFYHPGL